MSQYENGSPHIFQNEETYMKALDLFMGNDQNNSKKLEQILEEVLNKDNNLKHNVYNNNKSKK